MTKAELESRLAELGIDYPAKATKAQLEALLPDGEAQADDGAVKVRVVRPYRDRYTLEVRNAGDVIEVTAERMAELNTGKVRVERA